MPLLKALYPMGTILRTQIKKEFTKWIYPVRFCQLNQDVQRENIFKSRKEWEKQKELKVIIVDEPNDDVINKLTTNKLIDNHLSTMTTFENITTSDLGNFRQHKFYQDHETLIRIEGYYDGRSWDYGAPDEYPTWDSSHLIGSEVKFIDGKYVNVDDKYYPLDLVENSGYGIISYHENDLPLQRYNKNNPHSRNPSFTVIEQPKDSEWDFFSQNYFGAGKYFRRIKN